MSRLAQQQQPLTAQPSYGDRAVAYVDEKKAELQSYLGNELGSPAYVAAIAIVSTLIFVMVVFYLEYAFFNTSSDTGGAGLIGKAVSSSFFVSGHGILFYLFALVMIGGAAAAFGLMYVKDGSALVWSVVSSAIMSLIFFLGIKNLTDRASSASFWIWVAIGVLVPLVLGFYGWWSIRGQAAKMDLQANKTNTDEDKAIAKAYASRSTWALGMFVVDVIGVVGTFAGFWVLSPALTFTG